MTATDDLADELVQKIVALTIVRELVFRWSADKAWSDGTGAHVWSREGQSLTRKIGEHVADLAALRARSQVERKI